MPRKVLSDSDILLVLDMCIEAEQKCDRRIAIAIRNRQGASIEYLQVLKRQYASMKQHLLAEINQRGASDEKIRSQLGNLLLRREPPSDPTSKLDSLSRDDEKRG
jgi:hypothetical protein